MASNASQTSPRTLSTRKLNLSDLSDVNNEISGGITESNQRREDEKSDTNTSDVLPKASRSIVTSCSVDAKVEIIPCIR